MKIPSQSSNTPPKIAFSLLSTAQNRAVFVSEGASPGTLLAHLYANDPDEVTCTVVDPDSVAEVQAFPGNSEYLLVLSQHLDIEAQRYHDILVNCTDHSPTPLATSVRIPLEVLDENDNAPVFERNVYMAEVTENEYFVTKLLQVGAVDRDVESNEIKYALRQPTYALRVDETSGEVYTTAAIDREETPYFEVMVVASDSGKPPLSSTAIIRVTVDDVNDNAPVFKQDIYSVHFPENQVNSTKVLQVRAMDCDANENGKVVYSLNEPSTSLVHLGIDEDSGMVNITTMGLDRELTSHIDVTVVAHDRGAQWQLSSSATIRIIVDDVNDNIPVFEQNYYNFDVQENQPIGTVVLWVRATDMDADENGNVTYTLDGPSDGFDVDERTGELFVSSMLDREARSVYDFYIVARDHGLPQHSATVSIHVEVAGVNDNPPVFEQDTYAVTIFENEPLNTMLLQAKAVATDSSSRIVYFLEESSDILRIDNNGALFTAAMLDRELMSSFAVRVVAIDTGVPQWSATATVHVTVEDINDNTPMFAQSIYDVHTQENGNINTMLLQVQATDRDTGNNGAIVYSLVEPSTGQVVLRIDQTSGQVFTNRVLDREAMPSFNVTVVAHDLGIPQHTATATITVTVDDVNDNIPAFPVSDYAVKIPENADNGTIVITLYAFDADSGENGRVSYYMTARESDSPFSLSPEGVLSVAGALNREENAEYRMVVVASDNGVPSLTSFVSLTVEVI